MPARNKNRGKALLRRSTNRQEKSLEEQLSWAIHQAAAMDVPLDASMADLQHMTAHKLHHYKDLYVDDAITGSDLNRRGLVAVQRDALADKKTSHLFIYLPDRFARPEEPLEAALMEIKLRKAGLTIVFSNRTALPRQKGVNYFADNVQLLYQYTEAGEFLNHLAQRVIEGHIKAAEAGCRTGGRAPYGHARVLVDAHDSIVQELADGMRIRMPGHHIKIMPKDETKIHVWVMILDLYYNGKMGAKAIAGRLNELAIPSPDAGRFRGDRKGYRHKVSGKWNARTVISLIRNRTIIGLNRYGVQSQGKFRRLGKIGPRLLEDQDVREDGQPKVVANPESLVITQPTGFGPAADVKLFDACQDLLEKRGRSQRGISRRKDPARYPLALHVWDMTNGCGHPMYARTSGSRPLYVCGRYMKTDGAECDHNAVDGEAALAFILSVFQQRIEQFGGREALRNRLMRMAAAPHVETSDTLAQKELHRVQQQLVEAEEELKVIGRNMARARNNEAYKLMEAEFAAQQARVDRLRQERDHARPAAADRPQDVDPEAQVELALSLYDELEKIVNDPAARAAIPGLLDRINLRLWLNFAEGQNALRRPFRPRRACCSQRGIGVTGFEPATSWSRMNRRVDVTADNTALTSDTKRACTSACTPSERTDKPNHPTGDAFAAALAMIATLPLSDVEKAEAVRRLLAGKKVAN